MFSEENTVGIVVDNTGEPCLAHGIKKDELFALNIFYDSNGNVIDGLLQVSEEVKVYGRRRKKEKEKKEK